MGLTTQEAQQTSLSVCTRLETSAELDIMGLGSLNKSSCDLDLILGYSMDNLQNSLAKLFGFNSAVCYPCKSNLLQILTHF